MASDRNAVIVRIGIDVNDSIELRDEAAEAVGEAGALITTDHDRGDVLNGHSAYSIQDGNAPGLALAGVTAAMPSDGCRRACFH